MSIATDRLPLWTVVMPFVELGADLLLNGGTGLPTALAHGAALLAAVHHAELVALPVGEPFGAILLALAVTVIELGLIVSIMLGDQPEPTLLRDTIHAVVVLVLHGMAGLCIVVGALRHREQEFRTQGAQAHLIVLLPMVAITLVLPNFTTSAPGPYCTHAQRAFVSVACLALWLAFSFVQTERHREHFLPHPPGRPAEPEGTVSAARSSGRLSAAALGLLLVALVAVALLAKGVSLLFSAGGVGAGRADRAGGRDLRCHRAAARRHDGAARDDQLQTSIDLALGSGVASIGQTVPAVAFGAWWTGTPLALGVSPDGAVLLALSFMMALITYGTRRASLRSGLVPLILLATWLVLVVVPRAAVGAFSAPAGSRAPGRPS